MARKKRTPEENARREKIRELLQMANIGSGRISFAKRQRDMVCRCLVE